MGASTASVEPSGVPPVRVFQLADALSTTVAAVIASLKAESVEVKSARSLVDAAVAAKLLATVEPVGDKDVGRELIVRAFQRARSTGKSDWRQMTTAVLKNRLLDLTGGGFREAEYGAPSMPYFVSMYPELLQLVDTASGDVRVQVVEDALPPEVKDQTIVSPIRARLREDLWLAFFDYRRHSSYVWNLESELAEPGPPGPGRVAIPSLTAHEEANWREEFLSEIGDRLSPQSQAAVSNWIVSRSSTSELPPPLRGPWNGFVRERILARANEFFESNGLTVPLDLTSDADHPSRPSGRGSSALRDLVMRCVSTMSDRELEELRISPAVLLRVQGRDG